MTDRYFVRYGRADWTEVSKDTFMDAEIAAGFHSKSPGRPATGGFGSGVGPTAVNGRVTSDRINPDNWSWDPDFHRVLITTTTKETT